MTKNRMAIFRSLTLLRQASLDVSLIDAAYEGVPSTKLDALMEMLEDIVEDGHRVLVFSQFTRFLTMARAPDRGGRDRPTATSTAGPASGTTVIDRRSGPATPRCS